MINFSGISGVSNIYTYNDKNKKSIISSNNKRVSSPQTDTIEISFKGNATNQENNYFIEKKDNGMVLNRDKNTGDILSGVYPDGRKFTREYTEEGFIDKFENGRSKYYHLKVTPGETFGTKVRKTEDGGLEYKYQGLDINSWNSVTLAKLRPDCVSETYHNGKLMTITDEITGEKIGGGRIDKKKGEVTGEKYTVVDIEYECDYDENRYEYRKYENGKFEKVSDMGKSYEIKILPTEPCEEKDIKTETKDNGMVLKINKNTGDVLSGIYPDGRKFTRKYTEEGFIDKFENGRSKYYHLKVTPGETFGTKVRKTEDGGLEYKYQGLDINSWNSVTLAKLRPDCVSETYHNGKLMTITDEITGEKIGGGRIDKKKGEVTGEKYTVIDTEVDIINSESYEYRKFEDGHIEKEMIGFIISPCDAGCSSSNNSTKTVQTQKQIQNKSQNILYL